MLSVVRWYISDLPGVRPPDFAVQSHGVSMLPGIEQTFTVSADTCQYRYVREGRMYEFVDCEISADELDALYQVVRTNAFDRIGPAIPLTCSWIHSDADNWDELIVTANGTTYQKRPLHCELTIGENRYSQVSEAVYRIRERKISIGQADLVLFFRHAIGAPAEIASFKTDLYEQQHGVICAVRTAPVVEGHGGLVINFCPRSDPAARSAVAASIRASPLVEQVFEHINPDSIKTLE
jgi:hypothetical protein